MHKCRKKTPVFCLIKKARTAIHTYSPHLILHLHTVHCLWKSNILIMSLRLVVVLSGPVSFIRKGGTVADFGQKFCFGPDGLFLSLCSPKMRTFCDRRDSENLVRRQNAFEHLLRSFRFLVSQVRCGKRQDTISDKGGVHNTWLTRGNRYN